MITRIVSAAVLGLAAVLVVPLAADAAPVTPPPATAPYLVDAGLTPSPEVTEAWTSALSPDGTKLYSVGPDTGHLIESDAASGAVLRDLSVEPGLSALAVSPDGAEVYVASETSGQVSVVDVASFAVVNAFGVGSPVRGLAVSPTGSSLWVSRASSGDVEVFSIPGYTLIATYASTATPVGSVTFAPNGDAVLLGDGGITRIQPSGTSISFSGFYSGGTFPSDSGGFLVTAADGTVWFSRYGTGDVYSFSPTGTLSAPIHVGTEAAGLALSPDGSRLYVAIDGGAGAVALVDTGSRMLVRTFPAAHHFSFSLAMTPDGQHLLVGSGGGAGVDRMNVLDLAGTLVAPVGVIAGPGSPTFRVAMRDAAQGFDAGPYPAGGVHLQVRSAGGELVGEMSGPVDATGRAALPMPTATLAPGEYTASGTWSDGVTTIALSSAIMTVTAPPTVTVSADTAAAPRVLAATGVHAGGPLVAAIVLIAAGGGAVALRGIRQRRMRRA